MSRVFLAYLKINPAPIYLKTDAHQNWLLRLGLPGQKFGWVHGLTSALMVSLATVIFVYGLALLLFNNLGGIEPSDCLLEIFYLFGLGFTIGDGSYRVDLWVKCTLT